MKENGIRGLCELTPSVSSWGAWDTSLERARKESWIVENNLARALFGEGRSQNCEKSDVNVFGSFLWILITKLDCRKGSATLRMLDCIVEELGVS